MLLDVRGFQIEDRTSYSLQVGRGEGKYEDIQLEDHTVGRWPLEVTEAEPDLDEYVTEVQVKYINDESRADYANSEFVGISLTYSNGETFDYTGYGSSEEAYIVDTFQFTSINRFLGL